MRNLAVFWNDVRVGVLTERLPGRDYRFEYDADYVTSPMPHISVTMPKRLEPYESEHLFPVFANMVPEGALRRVVCHDHYIDEHDFFGLLMSMADKDTVGAVNFKNIE